MARSGFGHIRVKQTKKATKYEASHVIPGTRRRASKTFINIKNAKRWLRAQQVAIDSGTWTEPHDKEEHQPHHTTLRKAYDEWIKDKACTRKKSTVITYESKMKPVLERIGSRELGEIGAPLLNDMLRGLPASLGNAPAYGASNTLRNMCLWLIREGMLREDQIKHVRWIEYVPTRDPEARKLATVDEVWKLYEAMPEQWRIAVLIAAFCALRQGEIRGLRRKDFVETPQGMMIEVRRQISSKTGEVTSPKTKSGRRDIYVPNSIAFHIRTHLNTYVGNSPNAPLLTVIGSNHVVGQSTLDKAWQKARTKAGMGTFRFHDLRHTGLTLFAQQGATLAELMARGGHSDIATVQVYQEAAKERDLLITRRLDDAISGVA